MTFSTLIVDLWQIFVSWFDCCNAVQIFSLRICLVYMSEIDGMFWHYLCIWKLKKLRIRTGFDAPVLIRNFCKSSCWLLTRIVLVRIWAYVLVSSFKLYIFQQIPVWRWKFLFIYIAQNALPWNTGRLRKEVISWFLPVSYFAFLSQVRLARFFSKNSSS